MRFNMIASIFFVIHLALGFPVLKGRQTEDCETVHIFLARGTTEDYPGPLIDVVTAICDGVDSCGYEDIQYPASYLPDYCTSEGLGVVHGTSQVEDYASRCPDAQLVLSGYSQGAQVVGNILGGQSGGTTGCTNQDTTGWNATASPAVQIAAVTLFGDVTHVANQTYNTASGAAADGIYPRTGTQLDRFNEYSDKVRSWCLIDDPVCARGDDVNAHSTYFDLFTEEAAEWVQSKLTL